MTHWVGIDRLEAALTEMGDKAQSAAKTIVTKSSAVLVKAEKQGFQGSHPRNMPHVGGSAPNVVSGDLRRFIRMDGVKQYGVAAYRANVGPSLVYARRIELGFFGADRLGRKYHQPPFPYVKPATVTARPLMDQIARQEWAKVLH